MNATTNIVEVTVAYVEVEQLVFVEDATLEFVGGGTITNVI